VADAGRPRVLIVDDDEADGELTMRRLEALDADVDFHPGPEGAVEKIQQGGYAVVLLDLNMPGISGLQILDSLKQEGATARVLLYSAMETEALAEIGKAAGVAYLNKSAARSVLVERVRALIG